MLALKGIFSDFVLQMRKLRPEESDLPVVILVTSRAEPSLSLDVSLDS